MRLLNREQEIARLGRLYEGPEKWDKLMQHLYHQMGVLQNRAQVLLTLAAAVITLTSFSGRAIAETSPMARWTLITGLCIVFTAAALGLYVILPSLWITQQPGEDEHAWLSNSLAYRDQKTAAFKTSALLLLLGLFLYAVAISLMLLRTS
jgi:hypothetical protein